MGKRLFLSGSRASSAACDAFDSDISDELIPFSYLKPGTNNSIMELSNVSGMDILKKRKKERKRKRKKKKEKNIPDHVNTK